MNAADNLGRSQRLGKQVREEVERQLLVDLKHYGVEEEGITFDWSESLIEGHFVDWLDGILESFSSIVMLDKAGNLLGHGWMDFVLINNYSEPVIFWNFLTVRNKKVKRWPGAPDHVWSQLSLEEQQYQHRQSPRKPPKLP